MWRIVLIGAAWTALWWLIIGVFIAAVIPGGWLTIAATVAVIIVPLRVLVQRFRGAYPSAATRLFVFRPFWYVQLAAPLLAIGAVIGFFVGRAVRHRPCRRALDLVSSAFSLSSVRSPATLARGCFASNHWRRTSLTCPTD